MITVNRKCATPPYLCKKFCNLLLFLLCIFPLLTFIAFFPHHSYVFFCFSCIQKKKNIKQNLIYFVASVEILLNSHLYKAVRRLRCSLLILFWILRLWCLMITKFLVETTITKFVMLWYVSNYYVFFVDVKLWGFISFPLYFKILMLKMHVVLSLLCLS